MRWENKRRDKTKRDEMKEKKSHKTKREGNGWEESGKCIEGEGECEEKRRRETVGNNNRVTETHER